MDKYVTGAIIKKLRENKKMTQEELASKIYVSSKTISKWERGQGYPDISLLEPLSKALGISIIELLNGNDIKNDNRNFNILKSSFYVCPVCGNIIYSTGNALISCCGITLMPIDAEVMDDEHIINIEKIEDEYYVYIDHPMTKDHYISFIASISDDNVEIKKLYPETNACARFKIGKVKKIYAYCNHHGLFQLSYKDIR